MSVYTSLREANAARQEAWCRGGDPAPGLAFRGVELAGEVGEALNVIKKLERERRGWRGSRASLDDLADELADVIICADLAALAAGIDLDAAVVRKFNATSEKVGLPQRLKRVVHCVSPEEALVAAAESGGFLSIEDIRRICNAMPTIESGLLSAEETEAAGLARFGHHPDPAIDFEIEVESLQARLLDAKGDISKPGHAVETVASVLEDIERAMMFRVGGDPSAVRAKQILRDLEAVAKQAVQPTAPEAPRAAVRGDAKEIADRLRKVEGDVRRLCVDAAMMIEYLYTRPAEQAATDWPRGTRIRVEHDGFEGVVLGPYVTLEGKRGQVCQLAGAQVVHVYGEKWLQRADEVDAAPPIAAARPLEEWHEDHGSAVWWTWRDGDWLGEPSYVGSPLCDDWPGYHTHWTPHPAFPPAPAEELGK